jgi:hypothetical protein
MPRRERTYSVRIAQRRSFDPLKSSGSGRQVAIAPWRV